MMQFPSTNNKPLHNETNNADNKQMVLKKKILI